VGQQRQTVHRHVLWLGIAQGRCGLHCVCCLGSLLMIKP
jgi:hypothetical protein